MRVSLDHDTRSGQEEGEWSRGGGRDREGRKEGRQRAGDTSILEFRVVIALSLAWVLVLAS